MTYNVLSETLNTTIPIPTWYYGDKMLIQMLHEMGFGYKVVAAKFPTKNVLGLNNLKITS